jgi:cyclophilin family peptidyl-prolyl cis-trans isomerase
MSKRSRERQLAKLAARRQAERDATRHRRGLILGVIGVVASVFLVAGLGLYLSNGDDTEAASPTPSASVSPAEPTIACDGAVPADAGATKPTFGKVPKMTIDPDRTYTANITTSCGNIVVLLDQKAAPIAVNNFVFLADKGFYDGLTFHRIVADFVIQGGDPKGDGTGGPGYGFEIETTPDVTFDKAGILAYANSGPDSNGSQFFITLVPTPQLDPSTQGSFTIFGRVIEGLDVVRRIGAIPGTENPGIPGENSVPTQTVYIESVTISTEQ